MAATISRTTAATLLSNVQRGLSPIELLYTPNDRWPLPRKFRPHHLHLSISILDSSFNPPTKAHLALAKVPRHDPTGHAYDAKIFLLSVRNADKSLKPTDATYIQRLEMMLLLAQETVRKGHRHPIAVAVIDEPTFAGKASKLRAFLEERVVNLGIQRPELNFLMGFDTLERLFAPRYYGDSPEDPEAEAKMFKALDKFFSEEQDNARVVYARRGGSPNEEATLALADRFIQQKRVELVELDEDVDTTSSTRVREAIRERKSWAPLVPPSILQYLKNEKLYTWP
ncbi:hypothetical protein MIND_00273000 [Mycena indigotica]|uniref:Nicotinamide-nucleotide adenylyltransferase n=1 Tax=Mycena indigotica TaxID=2126181 RepID=A0A8H6T891_9AGAR|nr:uncharacterized protein MIND_00273000 [Mycena indigotica]KAF7312589.1 hypothetical protein MIND_00273000 [Mycena indigotica]